MANFESNPQPRQGVVNFSDTQIAFAHKNNNELRRTAWLFRFMNKSWLVNAGGTLGLWLHDARISIFNPIIKATVYHQFCGGTTLEESKEAIEHLRENNTLTILDYGAEGKTKEEEFDQTMKENLKAIQFASFNKSVPIISIKVTAVGSFDILEKYQSGEKLTQEEFSALQRIKDRLHLICADARDKGVAVFIDAEETWIQNTIDEIVKSLMEEHNKNKVVVYHTYQMYRKDKLQSLIKDHKEAKSKNYLLGAKIVRGAYMEKERKRAEEKGYPSPIHDSKQGSDKDFNEAIKYCVEHYLEIALCNASHNMESNLIQAELIAEKNIPRNHQHLNFCQLYGMSDNITFNLAAAGYNVAKYVPYGPVKEVIPYLIRRARENTAVTGEMSRELGLIVTEMKRRGMK